MGFKEDLEKGLDDIFSKGAEAITYNGEEISAIICDGQQTSGHDGLSIKVRKTDLPQPAYRDTVLRQGETWRVFQDKSRGIEIKGHGLVWLIPLTADERPKLL